MGRSDDAMVVRLPPSLSVRAFEETLYRAPELGRRLTFFDLSACTWIEPPVLLYLLALITDRLSKKQPSTIRLPWDTKVVQFLTAWKFAEAFLAATGRYLDEFVEKDSKEAAVNVRAEENLYLGTVIETPFGIDRLLSKYYFEINTFRNQHDLFSAPFALSEAAKWNRVSLVLRNVLRGPANLLASRIVYEALANAIRHPGAEVIQFVSHFRSRKGESASFVITFWDDGKPIASTLKDAVAAGGTIRPASDLGLRATYDVRLQQGYEPKMVETLVTSDQVPDRSASEQDYLLASVFPGTTSRPHSHAPVPEDLGDNRNSILSQPGMGLYLLANTAVSVYGGEVFIRSGQWRLRLNPGNKPDHYLAHLRHYKGRRSFHGNLITVRIPLKNRENR